MCQISEKSLVSCNWIASGSEIHVPGSISELKCLQHLECKRLYRMPKGISNMASAIRYAGLSIDENLAKMSQLQEVRLSFEHDMELKTMEEGVLAQLKKMRHLGILNLRMECPQFPEKMRAMKHLESLQLRKFPVPSWICDLVNLRELSLDDCEYSDFPEFQRMPNLVSLILEGNHRCRQLPKAFGKSGGFPHLRFFKIILFEELEKFPELEEGSMACLEKFTLSQCDKLQNIEGLERLKTVKDFIFEGLGARSWGMDKLRETFHEGGKYWNPVTIRTNFW
ncbi:hypothetical protein SUGI_0234840 [Cryptomeria japonica]|nr:hypothetical protein SUGI_0234840 [Cryptomeria japonica]